MTEEEKEKAKADDLTWLALVTNHASNTGMHGMPNVTRHKVFVRKVFWIIILLTAAGFMIGLITTSVSKYRSYPSETTVRPVLRSKLDFPAVTFCNMNPARASKLAQLGGMFVNYTGPQDESTFPPLQNVSDTEDLDDVNYSGDYEYEESSGDYNEEEAEIQETQDFFNLYRSLTFNTRRKVGHQLKTMLVLCQHQGVPCGPANFSYTQNSAYGNCFTYNSGRNFTQYKKALKAGPENALTMILYIEQREYVQDITDGAGLRFVIHNQTQVPFPEDEGFSVSPGTETFVGLNRVEQHLASDPYGPCRVVTHAENAVKNLWANLDSLHPKNYSTLACKYTCFQKNLISKCQCYDSRLPLSKIFKNYWRGAARICSLSIPEEQGCMEDVQDAFINSELDCNDLTMCPPSCESVHHDKTISIAMWPSLKTEEYTLNVLAGRDPGFRRDLEFLTDSERSAQARGNVLKIRIFFESLDYNKYTTNPSYELTQLLSDFGGQFGLWLGCSVVTIFELVELIWDLSILIYVKCKTNNQVVRSV